jgi:hypothetical protein
MTIKNKKQTYHDPYPEFKRCSCGRPYFYLESLKKCPVCGRKLIFYGDLVNEVILEYYSGYPYLISGKTLIEKIIYLAQIERKRVFKTTKQIFFEKDEAKYFKDILAFLKLFLKELDEKYRIIKEKEERNALSEKDPFENLIIKTINFNQCVDIYGKFLDTFSIKSISRKEIFKKLESLSVRSQKIIKYFLNHTIEETGKKFGVTRERIQVAVINALIKAFKDTEEYREFEKIEKEIEVARQKHSKAFKQYYQSEEERARQINKNSTTG